MGKFSLLVCLLLTPCLFQESESFAFTLILQGGIDLVNKLLNVIKFYNVAQNEDQCNTKNYQLNPQEILTSSGIRFIMTKLRNAQDNSSMFWTLDQILKTAEVIDNLFDNHVLLQNALKVSGNKQRFQNSTYRTHVQRVLGINSVGIESSLQQLTETIVPKYEIANNYRNINFPKLKDLADSSEATLSQMQILDELFSYLLVMDYKGYVMIQFAEELQKWLNGEAAPVSRKINCDKNNQRQVAIVDKFKHVISTASNEIQTRIPDERDEGEKYINLSDILLRIEQDNNLFDRDFECKTLCTTHVKKGSIAQCPHNDEKWKRGCENLENLPSFDNNDYFICLTEAFHLVIYKKDDVYQCTFCTCPCNYHRIYHISTDDVFANTEDGYVVTGARLVVENKIIRIQLQEGKLLKYGAIDPNSVEWIPLPDKPQQISRINAEDNLIELEKQTFPKNYIVIGMKFDYERYDEDGKNHVVLHLYGKKFDFTNGQIYHKQPLELFRDTYRSEESATVKYTYIDQNKLIDIQDIGTRYPSPLTGAGLVQKKIPFNQQALLLGLNLYTYNISSHFND